MTNIAVADVESQDIIGLLEVSQPHLRHIMARGSHFWIRFRYALQEPVLRQPRADAPTSGEVFEFVATLSVLGWGPRPMPAFWVLIANDESSAAVLRTIFETPDPLDLKAARDASRFKGAIHSAILSLAF